MCPFLGVCFAATGPSSFIRPLMLDLNTLPREDGPPSESVLKRQKFAVFEKHCSQVGVVLMAAACWALLQPAHSLQSRCCTPVLQGHEVCCLAVADCCWCSTQTQHRLLGDPQTLQHTCSSPSNTYPTVAMQRLASNAPPCCTTPLFCCPAAGGRWPVCLWRGRCAGQEHPAAAQHQPCGELRGGLVPRVFQGRRHPVQDTLAARWGRAGRSPQCGGVRAPAAAASICSGNSPEQH